MDSDIVVRRAGAEDGAAVRRLAALDSRRTPRGEVLVAAREGALVAAVPLGRGEPVADPFRPTADVVALLQLRACQLRACRT